MPAPGALPGILYFTRQKDCRVQALRLADLSLGRPGPKTACRLSVSPAGTVAAVRLDKGRVGLVRLESPPELVRTLGVAAGDVAWAPDGRRLAWCTEDGNTVVVALAGDRRQQVPGCHPRFAPDGSLLTLPHEPRPELLLRDGGTLLAKRDFLRGFPRGEPGPLGVLGYDTSAQGLLAVTVLLVGKSVVRTHLELWDEGDLEESIELARARVTSLALVGSIGPSRHLVRFSPDGNEVAIDVPGSISSLTLVDLRSGRRMLVGPTYRAFAWSPDGAWFALATDEGILVSGAERSDPVYVLPVRAAALAWR